jgi:phosphoenolpyruvate synthase/pyruvate phosphate dikinase
MPKSQASCNGDAGPKCGGSVPNPAAEREPDLIVPLRAADSAWTGGKAATLARLIRLGVSVPDGWVLTLHADRLLRSGQLSGHDLDALVRGRLTASYRAAARFAVRSSADVEDSAAASYAGQFLTELAVPRDEVPAAVRRVAASAASPSARSYARRLGVQPPAAIAVLVQEQVDPVLAGVCFSAHPVTGAGTVIVEHVHGGGEAVASGGALAGSHVLPRLPGGAVDTAPLAAAGRTAGWLTQAALLAIRLESALGCPQDVEWAVDGRQLWVLQSRPITTIGVRTQYRAGTAKARSGA